MKKTGAFFRSKDETCGRFTNGWLLLAVLGDATLPTADVLTLPAPLLTEKRLNCPGPPIGTRIGGSEDDDVDEDEINVGVETKVCNDTAELGTVGTETMLLGVETELVTTVDAAREIVGACGDVVNDVVGILRDDCEEIIPGNDAADVAENVDDVIVDDVEMNVAGDAVENLNVEENAKDVAGSVVAVTVFANSSELVH